MGELGRRSRRKPRGVLPQSIGDGVINQTFLVQDDRRVDLWQAGEGQSGDFDPNDPNDIEFWRFDVQERKDGEWETMDDARNIR